MIIPYKDILLKNQLFEGIGPENVEPLLDCLECRIKTYKKSECIAQEGEKLEFLGIVVEGSVSIVRENTVGDRVMMALLSPGDMFGEIAAFSENPLWPASVYAQLQCRILIVPPGVISKTCGKACRFHMLLIQNMLKTIAEKAMHLNRKLGYLTIKSLRGRICAFLYDQYKKTKMTTFSISMNRNELAEFLNVSRPSMSRELGRMKNEGMIDFYKEAFKILDIEKLATQGDGSSVQLKHFK